MEEKKTKFIVEMNQQNIYTAGLSTFIGLFIGIAAVIFLPAPLSTFIMIGCVVGGSFYMSFKMLRPDEYVLKIDKGFAALFKNDSKIADAADSQLDIQLLKIDRYTGFLSGNDQVLKMRVKFPNGKKVSFVVLDKNATFSDQVEHESFLTGGSMKYQGSFASSMQVQHLLDYYNLNHLVQLKSIY
jgi:hypothetical protein